MSRGQLFAENAIQDTPAEQMAAALCLVGCRMRPGDPARWVILVSSLVGGRGAWAPLPPALDLLHEAVDPVEDFWNVDALGVADAAAVVVGHVGVDAQDGVGAAE